MTLPRASLPTLRAFLGSIGLVKTSTVSPNLSIPSLQGGITQSDSDVRDVVNSLVNAVDGRASSGVYGITAHFSVDGTSATCDFWNGEGEKPTAAWDAGTSSQLVSYAGLTGQIDAAQATTNAALILGDPKAATATIVSTSQIRVRTFNDAGLTPVEFTVTIYLGRRLSE